MFHLKNTSSVFYYLFLENFKLLLIIQKFKKCFGLDILFKILTKHYQFFLLKILLVLPKRHVPLK